MKGTSDEHLSLLEHLAPLHDRLSSILVTTPQLVALTDMGKCFSFTQAVNLPILGLIENMSGFVCPCCGDISNVFSTGGGQEMANREKITFLGALPVDTELVDLLDAATETLSGDDPLEESIKSTSGSYSNIIQRYEKTHSSALFKPIVSTVIAALSK